MLDGQATDILEGSSLSFQSNYIDIYSNCWGPKDDGKTFGKPGRLAQEALMRGALEVRMKVVLSTFMDAPEINFLLINGSRYSRMDQVKFVEDSL